MTTTLPDPDPLAPWRPGAPIPAEEGRLLTRWGVRRRLVPAVAAICDCAIPSRQLPRRDDRLVAVLRLLIRFRSEEHPTCSPR